MRGQGAGFRWCAGRCELPETFVCRPTGVQINAPSRSPFLARATFLLPSRFRNDCHKLTLTLHAYDVSRCAGRRPGYWDSADGSCGDCHILQHCPYIRFRDWRHQTKAEDGRQSLQESHVFKPAIPKVQSAPVPQTIEGSRSEENNLPPNLGFGLGR